MPLINLIQEQRLAAQRNERKARSFFLAFVGIAVVAGGGFAFFFLESGSLAGQIAEVESRNKKNAPTVAEIEANHTELGILAPRLKTLEDAQTVTDRWNHILEHLTGQTPTQAWLTGLRCIATDPQKPITVSFTGMTTSQSSIGEFVLRTQNLTDFENVLFKFSNEKLVSSTKAIEFQVDADIVGTAEQKVKSEGDEKK